MHSFAALTVEEMAATEAGTQLDFIRSLLTSLAGPDSNADLLISLVIALLAQLGLA